MPLPRFQVLIQVIILHLLHLVALVPLVQCRQWYFFTGDTFPFLAVDGMTIPGVEQHRLGGIPVIGDSDSWSDEWINITRPAVPPPEKPPEEGSRQAPEDGKDEPQQQQQPQQLAIPERLSDQHWRPQVHFTPPKNWLNDPNGLFLDSRGIWHLYYQYGEDVWGNSWRHWGHATSLDLYTWTDHPIAIPFNDRDGSIWSGSIVVDVHNVSGLFQSVSHDNIIAYYTAWHPEQEAQALAYSVDGGLSFKQFPHNPIISQSRHNFRDPKISFHHPSQKWVMVLTYVDNVTFFTSEDLVSWKQVSIWDPGRNLGWIECPQLLEIPVRDSRKKTVGSKWMLVLSINGGGLNGAGVVKYILGTFDGERFTPEPPGKDVPDSSPGFMRGDDWVAYDTDFGPDKYATAFFHFPSNDDGGNDAVSISWAIEIGSSYLSTPTESEGWRHCMNGARQHWIDQESNSLMSTPSGDLSSMISNKFNPLVDLRSVAGIEGQSTIIRDNNPALDFVIRMRLPKYALQGGQSATASLRLTSTDIEDELLSFTMDFSHDAQSQQPVAKFTMARQGQRGWDKQGYWSPFKPLRPMSNSNNETLAEFEIRGVLDRSICEVYLNGGAAAGTMLYFTHGVLDHVVLSRGLDGKSSQIEFDFKMVALRSAWAKDDGKSSETGGKTAQEWSVLT